MNRTILLIDDDSSVREVVKMHLIKYGWQVWEAFNLDEILPFFKKRPDAVLMDGNLWKQREGAEYLKVMKGECPEVPVFMMSGNPGVEASVTYLGGVDGFFAKPIENWNEMNRMIEMAISSSKGVSD